ncbi:glutamyl aminopeptidase-like isoform X2 [Diorhabda carinulata]|uniref:glutamyl aminopeptidase-like isoform X2 n=2 Tax=Diorhabda carinulata TaxID=1163345 RepID=UPI0025A1FF38|nr:glutamyl aminopeptidase-like isoform X2 [Diorhabda carinulata]
MFHVLKAGKTKFSVFFSKNEIPKSTVSLGITTTIFGVDNTNLRKKVQNLEKEKISGQTNMNKYRLPDSVKPLLYDLYLYPDLKTGLFRGKVNITIDILSETDTISVHSNFLSIDSVKLSSESAIFTLEKTFELLNIKKSDNSIFKSGIENVEIEFNGDMKNRIVGLYTSSYKTSTGENRQIATSKFEPTYARQAFPCFDEPNLKAKYKVHLLKPKNNSYIALSNYPVASTEDYDEEHELVTFDETVSMSTYLSCFIVSDFDHTKTTFDNNGTMIPLKVYASPDNLYKTTYAAEIGKKVIEHYVNYFDIPYPLPKLDLVAIPDFVSGAMEHWGLVTFRETALLYTNTTHSTANKQRVATVIAHELAHSWFGNLVTMNWWNDLWLNEGFASYIEYKGALAAEPTWGMMEQFIISEMHSVLSLDATLSSHPIVQTVLTPDQITAIFDSISYNKGASILRMLEATVGEKIFQRGVKNYLNRHAYGNAVTKDLIEELQILYGNKLDVAEMLETFTVQMGYPILNVTVSGDIYTLTQKRFLIDPNATYNLNETKYRYKWSVPVTYVTDMGKSTEPILFKYNDDYITIKKPTGATWIKFNYDQIGYYRVNYPLSEWDNIIKNYDSLSKGDKTHLLEETFKIAEAGLLSYKVPLELSKKLKNERDYTPWSAGSNNLLSILNRLGSTKSEQESSFKDYLINIVTPAYKEFTWTENENDSHLNKLTRTVVISLACKAGYKDCLEQAEKKFDTWMKDRQFISPDLKSFVYIYGSTKASVETWNALLQIYQDENDASEKLKIMAGLCNVENVDLLKKLLEVTKNESIVRSQDYFDVLQTMSSNPIGTDLVWDFVRSNWQYLADRFTLNNRYLGSMIPTITSSFSTEEKLKEMEEFFEKYPNAGAGEANRKTALENVKNNIRWAANYKEIIEDWIINNKTI